VICCFRQIVYTRFACVSSIALESVERVSDFDDTDGAPRSTSFCGHDDDDEQKSIHCVTVLMDQMATDAGMCSYVSSVCSFQLRHLGTYLFR